MGVINYSGTTFGIPWCCQYIWITNISDMYEFLVHAHSGFRWIVLVAIIGAIVLASQGMRDGRSFNGSSRRWALIALVTTHIQFLMGLALYFISPYVQFGASVMKTANLRFFTVEHSVMMIIAIVLITLGFSRGKRKDTDKAKHKTVFWMYLIGLLIILISIPWPFRGFGNGWF